MSTEGRDKRTDDLLHVRGEAEKCPGTGVRGGMRDGGTAGSEGKRHSSGGKVSTK